MDVLERSPEAAGELGWTGGKHHIPDSSYLLDHVE